MAESNKLSSYGDRVSSSRDLLKFEPIHSLLNFLYSSNGMTHARFEEQKALAIRPLESWCPELPYLFQQENLLKG